MRNKNPDTAEQQTLKAIEAFASEAGTHARWVESLYLDRFPATDRMRTKLVKAGVNAAKRQLRSDALVVELRDLLARGVNVTSMTEDELAMWRGEAAAIVERTT